MNQGTFVARQLATPHMQYDPEAWLAGLDGGVERALRVHQDEPGFLFVTGGLESPGCSYRWVRAGAEPQALVLGRHNACGLRVQGGHWSLRHILALVLWNEEGPTVRLVDLGSASAFASEHGVGLGGATFSGSAFFSVGTTAVGVLETGRGEGAVLPPRILVEEPRRSRSHHKRGRAFIDREATLIRPEEISLFSADGRFDGPAVAELSISADDRGTHVDLGSEILTRGLLIGRYDRCGLMPSEDLRLSRVHVLLLSLDGDVYAIDTASTSGLKCEGRRVSVCALGAQTELEFGGLVLGWRHRGL